MADRVGWHEAPIEVHAFHLCIGRQHVAAPRGWLDHGRVVAGADHDPGRHREARLDAGDQRMLAESASDE